MRMALLFSLPIFLAFLSLSPLPLAARRGVVSLASLLLLMLWLPLFWSFESQSLLIGAWPHYAGIAWKSDPLSTIFVGVVICLYFPTAWVLCAMKGKELCIFHFLVASLMGCFLTSDFFNLFVMFEIFLMSSYALFFRSQPLRDALSFLWVNVFASVLFLFSMAYMYRALGTLNMADVAVRFPLLSISDQNILFSSLSLVFLLKAGLLPLMFWMPKSYLSLPSAILAFLAALGTKVGIYSFLRLVDVVGLPTLERFQWEIGFAAAIGFFAFGWVAFRRDQLKASFIYMGLAHLSYILFAISLASAMSWAGALTYFVADAFFISALFFFESDYRRAGRPGFVWEHSPFSALVLLFVLLAGAGLPPLGGFWGKWLILRSATDQPALLILLLLMSFGLLLWSAWVWSRYFNRPTSQTQSMKLRLSLPTLFCSGLLIFSSGAFLYSPYLFMEAAQKSTRIESQRDIFWDHTQEVESYREMQKELRRLQP